MAASAASLRGAPPSSPARPALSLLQCAEYSVASQTVRPGEPPAGRRSLVDRFAAGGQSLDERRERARERALERWPLGARLPHDASPQATVAVRDERACRRPRGPRLAQPQPCRGCHGCTAARAVVLHVEPCVVAAWRVHALEPLPFGAAARARLDRVRPLGDVQLLPVRSAARLAGAVRGARPHTLSVSLSLRQTSSRVLLERELMLRLAPTLDNGRVSCSSTAGARRCWPCSRC